MKRMSIFKYHHIKTQKQVFYNFNVLFKQKVNENLYKSTVTSLMNNESFTSNHTRNNLNGNNNYTNNFNNNDNVWHGTPVQRYHL